MLCSCALLITIQNPAKGIWVNDTTVIQTGSAISEKPIILNAPSIGLNINAASFVKTYLKKSNLTLVAAKKRGGTVFPIMDSVFTMYDLPAQLKYLAVVESNLKISVRSQLGAAGMWQLMPSAAKTFGLKAGKDYDERFHVYKSTVAAARYLKQLYDEFGDWLLAIAAYNAGSGRLHRAIRQAGSHDFWRLQNFLPGETRNHVKKYISVHYYFEKQGSITTMTKAETQQYTKTLAEFTTDNSAASVTVKEAVNKPL